MKTNSISLRCAPFTSTYPLVSVLMNGPEMRELSISCLSAARPSTYGPRPILIRHVALEFHSVTKSDDVSVTTGE